MSSPKVMIRLAGALVMGCALSGLGSLPAVAAQGDGERGTVSLRMVQVGDPGNPSVGVVSVFGTPGDFVNKTTDGGIYVSCDEAPPAPPECITTGAVDYVYEIGELEVTVAQYVTFLNTVDPQGRGRHDLYFDNMSPDVWAKYGSVRRLTGADVARGRNVAPGSSTMSPSPLLNASGAQVMGSMATLWRARAPSVSPVKTIR